MTGIFINQNSKKNFQPLISFKRLGLRKSSKRSFCKTFPFPRKIMKRDILSSSWKRDM